LDAKGELITYAGLEVVEGEAERKIASQVESIARLASDLMKLALKSNSHRQGISDVSMSP